MSNLIIFALIKDYYVECYDFKNTKMVFWPFYIQTAKQKVIIIIKFPKKCGLKEKLADIVFGRQNNFLKATLLALMKILLFIYTELLSLKPRTIEGRYYSPNTTITSHQIILISQVLLISPNFCFIISLYIILMLAFFFLF